MESTRQSDQSRSETPPRRGALGRPRAQLPFGERKRLKRSAARTLIARRTRKPPTAAQLAFDPLVRAAHRPGRRRTRLVLAVVGSLVLHAAALTVGLVMRAGTTGPRNDQVTIEMRQKPPEPPPPPPEKKPEPEPVEKPARQPPKVAKLPPPPAEPPPPTKTAPVRIVGLSLESTSGEGGDGPTFAVGNTRQGETEKKAADPKPLPPPPPAPPAPVVGAGRGNAVASRIPVAGVKYEKPKPRKTPEPDYPPDLKSQAIEGDVMVLVSIGIDGKVTDVKILKPAPYPAFNESARAAVMQYEYEPATRDGEPTAYQLSFTVRFRLKENE